MQLHVQLTLPREARYVPAIRGVAACLLAEVEAPDDAIDDIKLALSEACGNVVVHATGVDSYSVALTVRPDSCEVEVVDLGPGFVEPEVGMTSEAGMASATWMMSEADALDLQAEHGRGIGLIRALVDDLEFIRDDEATRVRLVKHWPGVGLASREPLRTGAAVASATEGAPLPG
ncbi:ATP-binding protein [Egibacter rhizosphaerae]|uniref:ATP-binding protein n=1 Tax=Egibacter rhizosphaerae TaxID=1670831 RepID=A0A411YJG3_9ACTN|nr:ATP-binding protein [Egibacter rhizosphaerae]QBI21380.1 ATP-binding protein [Egibacter rhizosphaerae]